MNTWNSNYVRSNYAKQALGFITNVNGNIELQHPAVGSTIRQLVQTEDADPNLSETVRRARETFLANTKSGFKYMQPHFGYVVKWLSELGKTAELDALLAYADTQFRPTWDEGGLYYPRQDQITDESGSWKFVDPFTGNAAIGYARLNVEDGQKKMWDEPWTRELLTSRPWVDGLDYSQGVDCLRGRWIDEESAMVITLRSWDGAEHRLEFSVHGLSAGDWELYENGALVSESSVLERGSVRISTTMPQKQEIDIVLIQAA
jgi:hypothetical protein